MGRVFGILAVALTITSVANASSKGRLINHMTGQEYLAGGQALVLPARSFVAELNDGLVCVEGSAKDVAKKLNVDNQASQSKEKRSKVKAKGDSVVITYEESICKEWSAGYQDDPGDCLKSEDGMLKLVIPNCSTKVGNVYFDQTAFHEKSLKLKGWLFIPQVSKTVKGDFVKNGWVRTFVMGPTKAAIQLRADEAEFLLGTAWIDSTTLKQVRNGKTVELGRECKVVRSENPYQARLTCGTNTVFIPIELLMGEIPLGLRNLSLERKLDYDLKVDEWSMKQTKATLRETLALAAEYPTEFSGDAIAFCSDIRRVLGDQKSIGVQIVGADKQLNTASTWSIDSKTGNVVGTKTIKCLQGVETENGSYCQAWDIKEVARIAVDCR